MLTDFACIQVLHCFPWIKSEEVLDIIDHYRTLERVFIHLGSEREQQISAYLSLERLSKCSRDERKSLVTRIMEEFDPQAAEELDGDEEFEFYDECPEEIPQDLESLEEIYGPEVATEIYYELQRSAFQDQPSRSTQEEPDAASVSYSDAEATTERYCSEVVAQQLSPPTVSSLQPHTKAMKRRMRVKRTYALPSAYLDKTSDHDGRCAVSSLKEPDESYEAQVQIALELEQVGLSPKGDETLFQGKSWTDSGHYYPTGKRTWHLYKSNLSVYAALLRLRKKMVNHPAKDELRSPIPPDETATTAQLPGFLRLMYFTSSNGQESLGRERPKSMRLWRRLLTE